ncbi:MAG: hypothetical protein IJM36_04975 [Acholeplasmatales bacterium]|nr:hypothetical protein [Acholeplasmatales bacterium]
MKKGVLVLGVGAVALAALSSCDKKEEKIDSKENFGKYEDFEANKDNYELGKDYFKLIIANPDPDKTGEDEYHYSYHLAGETVAEFDILILGEKISVKTCLQAYDDYFENVEFGYSTYDEGITYYFAEAKKDNVNIVDTTNLLILFNNEYSNYTINNFTPAGADKKLDTTDDNLKELTIVKNAWIY